MAKSQLALTKIDRSLCVVIPAYKVSRQILEVLSKIDDYVKYIVVVDDACPEASGEIVLQGCADKRVILVKHSENLGVGAATKSGYKKALELGADIVVKVDGDGQMNLSDLRTLVEPIIDGKADYTKGNRFYNIDQVQSMPKIRIVGNLALSFFCKFSSGYWNIFDPNNGYTAISSSILKTLPLDKIENRFFFESDMLFRLYLSRAKVVDVPLNAIYADEKSNLTISRSIFEFFGKHVRNSFKRIFYMYYLREFSLASIELPLGLGLGIFGITLGLQSWITSANLGVGTNTGTQILVAISCLASLQLILSFADFDSRNYPNEVRFPR
jgi:glycosyltransferase involved in cell wall biosynthesis